MSPDSTPATVRAVVLDFFGTLTDPAAETLRRTTFEATASALGVPAETFYEAMASTFPARIVGAFGDTRSTLASIAVRCGARPSLAVLDRAVQVHLAGAERVRPPRAGALETLDELRRRGLRTGLISDCSSELVESWAATPFAARIDAPLFSWREGHRKPDPRLYATAAARLGVTPAECVYVGDGGSREHQGARAAGMTPVLITNPGHDHHRDDPDTWIPALVIPDLHALLDLLQPGR